MNRLDGIFVDISNPDREGHAGLRQHRAPRGAF
jgi:hypothetical protein